jgi:hypothetical protein
MRRVVIAVAGLMLWGLPAIAQVVPPPSRKVERLKTLKIVEPTDVQLNRQELWAFLPIIPGDLYQLVARVHPENATNKKITWESSDHKVAIVNSSGRVIPQSVGTAVIKAVSQANGLQATCRVVVEKTAKFFGNTIGNLLNGGLMARQGSWVYFSDPLRGSRLSKMKVDGSGIVPLCDDIPSSINVWRDKIYYVNRSDGDKLYAIDIYGENRKWLGDSNPVSGAQYYKGEILYGAPDPNNRTILYTIKPDGTGRRVVDWPGLGSVSFFFRDGYAALYSLFYRQAGNPTQIGLVLHRPLEAASAAAQVYGGVHRGFLATLDETGDTPRFVLVFYLTTTGEIRRANAPRPSISQTEDALLIKPQPGARSLACEMGWVYYANDLGVSKIRGRGEQNQLLARIPANTAAKIFPMAVGTTPEETWVFYYVIPQVSNMGPTRIFRVRGNGLDNRQIR